MKSREVSLFILIFVLAVELRSSAALQVTLFEHKDRLGQSLKLNVKGCMSVPPEWDNQASSVDTHGDCVIFYEKVDCKGKHVALQPYHDEFQKDLAQEKLAFSDVVSSVGSCGDKLKRGKYVVQNNADGSILSIHKGHIFMYPWSFNMSVRKDQEWQIDLEEDQRVTYYEIMPVKKNERKNPLSYEKSTLYDYTEEEKVTKLHIKPDPIKNYYIIESAHKGKFRIRNSNNGKCLFRGKQGRVAQNWCDNWSKSQEWIFRPLPAKPKERKKYRVPPPLVRPETKVKRPTFPFGIPPYPPGQFQFPLGHPLYQPPVAPIKKKDEKKKKKKKGSEDEEDDEEAKSKESRESKEEEQEDESKQTKDEEEEEDEVQTKNTKESEEEVDNRKIKKKTNEDAEEDEEEEEEEEEEA